MTISRLLFAFNFKFLFSMQFFRLQTRSFRSSLSVLNKIYVGNLSWGASEEGLRDAFSKFGPLSDVFVVRDKLSGRSKGFAFLTFEQKEDSEAAIQDMNEAIFEGRNLRVNEATEKPPRENFSNNGY